MSSRSNWIEIVVITGRAGSGKTTLAAWLRDFHGAHVYSMANVLKRIAADTLGFRASQLYGDPVSKETEDERIGMSPRRFLQLLGSSVQANFGADTLPRGTIKAIEESPFFKAGEIFVVDDCRYPLEKAMFKAMENENRGVRVHTVKVVNPQQGPLNPEHEHSSESSVDLIGAEYTFSNLKGLEGPSKLFHDFSNKVPGPWSLI